MGGGGSSGVGVVQVRWGLFQLSGAGCSGQRAGGSDGERSFRWSYGGGGCLLGAKEQTLRVRG